MDITRRSLIAGLAPISLNAWQVRPDPFVAISPDRLAVEISPSIVIGGKTFSPNTPPKGFRNEPSVGILVHDSMRSRLIHAWPAGKDFCGEARAEKMPNGDYVLMFPAGPAHYGHKITKVNDMVLYRSSDRGRTWSGPVIPWELPYNQHAFVPLVPRGSKTAYAFGTEPRFDSFDGDENAPIGYRTSNDSGESWSPVTLIRPKNDPEFRGMYVMRVAETTRGTWILAPHEADWKRTPLTSWLYVLRSEDRGKSWELLPGPRHQGWTEPTKSRFEEGRPIALGGSKVMILVRTAEGHLWQIRSEDDGKTWSKPQPTSLVHPSAPPMIFTLSDGKTLAVFYHNRYSGISSVDKSGNMGQDRSELWVAFSSDEGLTWSEPQFVLANTAQPPEEANSWRWSVSYIDALIDRGLVTIIIAHQHKRVLSIQFDEALLRKLPTKVQLA